MAIREYWPSYWRQMRESWDYNERQHDQRVGWLNLLDNLNKTEEEMMLLWVKEKYDPEKYEFFAEKDFKFNGRENLIKRCILNILENGLVYGTKVFVEIRKSMNNLIITIEDDGPGLPKTEYVNVFRPFYRVDKSRGLNKSGVGLGLSISQDIVKSHGGNISLSESKHKGLFVKISLPF